MKKNNNYYLIILLTSLSFIFLLSCSQTTEPNMPGSNNIKKISTSIPSVLVSTNDEDAILGFLQAKHEKYSNAQYDEYSVSTYVYQDLNKENLADVGDVVVSNYLMTTPDNDNFYRKILNGNSSKLPDFGKTSQFSIEGNSNYNIAGFNESFYVPQKITVSNYFQDNELNKTQSLTLNWNSDVDNDNGCYIFIEYQPDLSREYDSSLPDSIIYWTQNVTDNGSYTIPTNVLQNFPTGGKVKLIVVRGNGKIVDVNSKKFLLLAYSSYWYLLDVVDN